jgi:heptaprenylglyceryl phosphate synthase
MHANAGTMPMEKNVVYQSILSKLKQEGALHATLIDPDVMKQSCPVAGQMAHCPQ